MLFNTIFDFLYKFHGDQLLKEAWTPTTKRVQDKLLHYHCEK